MDGEITCDPDLSSPYGLGQFADYLSLIHIYLEQSKIIAEHIPFLGWASATVGSPQIRNRCTLGGSIGNAFPASDPLPALIAADALIRV